MSNVRKNPQPSEFENESPACNLSELTAVVTSLHEITQALLAISQAEALPGEPGATEDAAGEPAAPARAGETRTYYFPPAAVQQERELLVRQGAKDFKDLLGEVHMLLAGLVKLMKNVQTDVRIRGHLIYSLGCLLDQVAALLMRMRNIYGKVRLVRG